MKKILVQDSDKDIREVIKLTLEDHDSIVYITNSTDNLPTEIRDFNPDVILLDYKIHGEMCIEACNTIKALDPSLPIVAMSCNSEISKLYKNHLFDDYLTKPFDTPMLLAVVERNFVG